MTQVDFYSNAGNKVATACQLAAKALDRGLRVVVYTSDGSLCQAVDRMLWAVPALGFIPHCAPDHPLATETPIIVSRVETQLPHDDVLINIDPAVPQFFGRYHRLIEIVTAADDDREQARGRFRFYRDRGYEIRTIDLRDRGA